MSTQFKREKNWKHLYLRSEKLARARQLRFDYPRIPEEAMAHEADALRNSNQIHVLFVCSRNQWRSPTAEQVWRRHPALAVRSGGTSPNAKHPVSAADISWAHVIFVMEEKHKSRLQATYQRMLVNKPIHVLDIPDEYKFMDPELVDLLRESVAGVLGIE